MHSAFRRGVELLSAQESNSVKSQGKTAGSLGSASEHVGGNSRVPKDAAQLEPVINELMQKVSMIAI